MTNENAVVQHQVICISNLCVRQVGLMAKNAYDTRHSSPYDSVLLVTNGSIRAAIVDEDVYTEFKAPHIVILEKDKEYILEALDDETIVYDISALRTSTGDIVNPDNLVRADYPFNTSKPFEEHTK